MKYRDTRLEAMAESGRGRTPKDHWIKCWPGAFAATVEGSKPWEWRKDDRRYRTGDLVTLCEWDPDKKQFTGRILGRRIGFLLRGRHGVPAGYCVFTVHPRGNYNDPDVYYSTDHVAEQYKKNNPPPKRKKAKKAIKTKKAARR